MVNLKIFLVTYDIIEDRALNELSQVELDDILCYSVQKSVPKNISNKIKVINEWELEWNDFSFQNEKYYEYGTFVHLIKNYKLIEELTHIGILHYDVFFKKNSVNYIKTELEKNHNKIFYNKIRGLQDLWLTETEFYNICSFMKERGLYIDIDKIIRYGWISECLSIVPIEIFNKFGEFMISYRNDIEDIIKKNKWGIMNNINHRICGIVERMWGFYLISQQSQFEKMNIVHDWNSYNHQHLKEK
jgi:hypothetical protein